MKATMGDSFRARAIRMHASPTARSVTAGKMARASDIVGA